MSLKIMWALKQCLVAVLIGTAALTAPKAEAATVHSNLVQGSGNTGITTTITNDDNAIYGSATFDLVGTYEGVLQGIKDNNPTYASSSLNQIAQTIGINIEDTPSSASNGWNANYDVGTGLLTFTNIGGIPGLTYDQWNSADPNNYQLEFTANFAANDFNGNGITDANEVLLQDGALENGFEGYINFDNQVHTSIPQFTTAVPEPSGTMFALAGITSLLFRRVKRA